MTETKATGVSQRRFFLGTVRSRRENWQDFCAEPEQRANLVKADAIARDIATKFAKQEENAYKVPYHSMIAAAAVVDDAGELVFQANDADPMGTVSCMLLDFMEAHHLPTPNPVANGHTDIGCRWFGFDIQTVMEVVRSDVMYRNARMKPIVPIPPGIWFYPMFQPAPWMDPYEVLVKSDLRKDIDIACVADFLQDRVPEAVGADPVASALLALALAKAGHLFPQE